MKAITIHQPWASLIAIGAKRFETRGWKTNYRGPLAIHAGKKIDNAAVLMLAQNYTKIWHEISPLPTGAIVAIAELTECWRASDCLFCDNKPLLVKQGDTLIISDLEYAFGDFSPGRYAWEMSNVQMLDKPIAAKGQQGLWNRNPPEGVDWI